MFSPFLRSISGNESRSISNYHLPEDNPPARFILPDTVFHWDGQPNKRLFAILNKPGIKCFLIKSKQILPVL